MQQKKSAHVHWFFHRWVLGSGEKMKDKVIIIDQNELSDRLVGGLVENDTTNLLSDNDRTVFDEMQAQIKQNLPEWDYEI